MIYALVVFSIGLALSAFFSGSETGYYRVPRVRLVIDAVGGDRIARGLLWASNHPEAFVSTALVGNNVANYLASSAIVAAAGLLIPSAGLTGEILLTLALAPVVFVFGELLPKRAFLQAPYGLLRRCAPMLLIAGVVLAAGSSLLWLASRAMSLATGAKIQPLRMTLRRRELSDVFAEGQAVGLLTPAQRDLAQATFTLGERPLRDFMTPVGRQPRLPKGAGAEEVLRLARQHRFDAWPLEAARDAPNQYVRASSVLTSTAEGEALPLEPLHELVETTPYLQALTHLESHGQPIAAVKGAGGRVIGYVRTAKLQQAIWDAS